MMALAMTSMFPPQPEVDKSCQDSLPLSELSRPSASDGAAVSCGALPVFRVQQHQRPGPRVRALRLRPRRRLERVEGADDRGTRRVARSTCCFGNCENNCENGSSNAEVLVARPEP